MKVGGDSSGILILSMIFLDFCEVSNECSGLATKSEQLQLPF